jgi:hypothetical protein
MMLLVSFLHHDGKDPPRKNSAQKSEKLTF